MRWQLAIFDMDGTILDTLEDLTDAVNHCMQLFGMPVRTLDEVRQFVGNGIHRLVERAVPAGTSGQTIEAVYAEFNRFYQEHCAEKTRPYAGIPEVLAALRRSGVKTAVVSNKADYAVKSLCDRYFPGLFDCAVGDRPGQRRKPYPDSVLAVLAHFQLSRENAVYIGDSEVDLQTAENAGVDVIPVGWGFRTEAFLRQQGADEVLHTPAALTGRILEES